jgi:transcriptional regulator with XRE-family HTH domain
MTSEELRAKRLECGLSQAALAKLMQVSENTVARWERGEVAINQGLAHLAFKVIKLKKDRGTA